MDTDGWRDNHGRDCTYYAANMCLNGAPREGVVFGRKSRKPHKNCCACGKQKSGEFLKTFFEEESLYIMIVTPS